MDVAELLDELRSGILRDTAELKSGPDAHYWTDARLLRYLDDAHSRFARLALCIHDDTTPQVTQVKLRNGVAIYQLDKSIISVLSARHQDDTQDLVRLTHETAMTNSNTFTETFEFATFTPPGKPNSFTTDEGIDPSARAATRFRVMGTPTVDQDGKLIYLRVIRKPIRKFSEEKLDAHPEIPEDYHLELPEWAAYRALRNWDIDGEDRTKAENHRKRFEEAVVECKRDTLRKTWTGLRWIMGQNAFAGWVKN